MGFFSSKHVFTAYAASNSLIDEENRNSTVLGLMLQSVVTGETTLAESVKLGLQTDLYARARSMVRFGLRDDGYFYGLPEPSHTYRDYLPIVPLMHDRVWFDEVNNEELEDTTDRMLKKLAIDPYEVKEEYIATVEEGIASGDRPGTDELDDWDFFIHFAVPMHTTTRGSREYLWNYFQWLEQHRTWTYRADYEVFLNSGQTGDQPASSFRISEGEGSNPDWRISGTGYEAFYKYSYIESVTHAGEYTPPGWTEPLSVNHCYSKIYRLTDSDYAEGIEEVHGVGASVATSEPTGTYHTYAVFTKQNNDDTYTQVLIMSPSMMYVINVTDEDDVTDWQYCDVPLFPEDPEEDSEFRWPIMVESLKETSAMHREEMLQEALCATVFLIEHVKVKWYQRTFFRWLIVIAVIIIVVISYQYHLLGTIKGLAATALAAGATGTALAFSALYVAMTFALGFLIAFAGSVLGGYWGQIFVIFATLYMAGLNPFANLSQAWGNLATQASFGSALGFLQAVMPILKVIEVGYSAYELDKLEDKMKDFTKSAREKYDELRDAYDMLGEIPAGLDPLFITSVFTGTFPESPQSFYDRSLNANPGVLGYDLINDFSEIALTLPEAENDGGIVDTIMDSFERQRGAA
jgi:hypothetical protein